MKRDFQRKIALRIFRYVKGRGDSGSEFEFNRLNSAEQKGWMRLAKTLYWHGSRAFMPEIDP